MAVRWPQSTIISHCVAYEMSAQIIAPLTTCLCFFLCLGFLAGFTPSPHPSVSQSTFLLFACYSVSGTPSYYFLCPLSEWMHCEMFQLQWCFLYFIVLKCPVKQQQQQTARAFLLELDSCAAEDFSTFVKWCPEVRAHSCPSHRICFSSSQRVDLPLSSCHYKWDTYCCLK